MTGAVSAAGVRNALARTLAALALVAGLAFIHVTACQTVVAALACCPPGTTVARGSSALPGGSDLGFSGVRETGSTAAGPAGAEAPGAELRGAGFGLGPIAAPGGADAPDGPVPVGPTSDLLGAPELPGEPADVLGACLLVLLAIMLVALALRRARVVRPPPGRALFVLPRLRSRLLTGPALAQLCVLRT